MSTILVYSGDGVSTLSLNETIKTFQNLFPKSPVATVDHKTLSLSNWEASTHLVVFPGGRDIPYNRDLKGKGTEKLRQFVANGGNFIGICAGAYFASKFIEFERGSKLEICDSRFLEFFPGKAIGTLYGPFNYHSNEGAYASPIALGEGITPLYYNGGCYFEGAEQMPNTEVIGTYSDHDNKAAIISCSFGKGRAILSGVHFEINAESLKGGNHRSPVVDSLLEGESGRLKFLRSLDM